MNLKLSDRQSTVVLWQDRDVRFDVGSKELLIKDSEQKIRTFFSVEDTKGKPLKKGLFFLSLSENNKVPLSQKATPVIMVN